jgi:glycosyltransferase involved in cell wall biosynthesis
MTETIPTVSIITPSFNQGVYIGETIESVISQEGDFYIEYIIVDGGSTDDSVAIIKKYAQLVASGTYRSNCRGINIHWSSGKDKGQADAINKGLARIQGEIVGWINSDDLFFSGAFSTVVRHFGQNPQDDFVFGDGDVIDEHGGVQWEWLSRPYDFSLLRSYHFAFNEFTNYIMQQAVFWRRRVHEKIGLLDPSFHYVMDYEYWLRAGEAGLRMRHIPVKLGKFRLIAGTKSLSDPMVFWLEMLEVFRRYNGAEKMAPFFVYYLFNEGLHNGFDPDTLYRCKEVVFDRYSSLERQERAVLEAKFEKAYPKACLMLSKEAFLRGDTAKSKLLQQKAVSLSPLIRFHPLSLVLFAERALGQQLLLSLRKIWMWLLHQYRMRRYFYRYRSGHRKHYEC